jgi:hypothetical protein
MYPASHVFDWDRWQDGFDERWNGDANKGVRQEFRTFKNYSTSTLPCLKAWSQIGGLRGG